MLNYSHFRTTFLLLIVLSMTSCAAVDPTMWRHNDNGRYNDSIEYFETTYSYANIEISQIKYICEAYHQTKNYRKLDECIQAANLRYKKHDKKLDELQAPIEASVKAPIDTLTALYYLDLGETSLAKKYSSEAVNTLENIIHNKTFMQKMNEPKFVGILEKELLMHAYRASGISNAMTGNFVEAEKDIEKIKNLSGVSSNDLTYKTQPMYIAQINMSLKKYAAAEKALTDISWYGAFRGIATLGMGFATTPVMEQIGDKSRLRARKFMLAKIDYETGNKSKAGQIYKELLADPYIKGHGTLYTTILHDLAMLYFQDGDTTNALDLLKRAVSSVEQQRSTINTEASRIGFIGDKQQIYRDLIEILLRKNQTKEAFFYAEKSKSRALVDMLAMKKSFGEGIQKKQSQILLEQINLAENNAVLAANSQGDSKGPTKTKGVKIRSLIEHQTIDAQLSSLISVHSLPVNKIQSLLADDETLVEFYGGEDTMTAFIVTSNEITATPISSRKLTEHINTLRKDILQYNSDQYMTQAQLIYTQVMAPVIPHLRNKKLTIVAHGPLHYLPFNALHDGTSFLIDSYAIRILPSASVLALLDKGNRRDDSLLALSNPDLGNVAYDLPAAEHEGRAITQGKSNAKNLSRKFATETALRLYGPTVARLHIASHGQFNAETPLESRLLLAKDNSNDGALTVGDLYDISLGNDLVTLSACETGLGKVSNGDDVIGLTRGFLFSGAKSIVSTLWVVDDTATSELMVSFYDSLGNNSKLESLRKAQLKIKKEYNPHPFFWAAFQLTGNI